MDGLMAPAGEEAADPVRVLPQKGLVQSQVGPQAGQRLGGGMNPQDDLSRVAGKHEQDREHRD